MKVSFDIITGTSIGAFNGALLAEFRHQGIGEEETIHRMEEIWANLGGFMALNWKGFLSHILSPLKIPSIYSNKNMREVLEKYIPRRRQFFDYKNCQLSVTGTNITDKNLHIFDFNSTTPVIEAVLASMSYPVAFPAIEIDGDYFIDGGALCNAPLKEALQWGAENIYLIFLSPMKVIEGKYSFDDSGHAAQKVIGEYLDLATNILMYGDLKRAEQLNQIITLLTKYQHRLPEEFLKEIRELYSLKYKGGGRVINIKRIAPESSLDPPGLRGFKNHKAIEKITRMGEDDTIMLFSRGEI
jgi:NTE family protein